MMEMDERQRWCCLSCCDAVRMPSHDVTKWQLERRFRDPFQGNYEKIHIPISC